MLQRTDTSPLLQDVAVLASVHGEEWARRLLRDRKRTDYPDLSTWEIIGVVEILRRYPANAIRTPEHCLNILKKE